MTPFIAGTIFGALFMGSVFTLFLTRARRPRRDPIDWTPEFHEPPPPAVTRLTINKRSYTL